MSYDPWAITGDDIDDALDYYHDLETLLGWWCTRLKTRVEAAQRAELEALQLAERDSSAQVDVLRSVIDEKTAEVQELVEGERCC